MSVLQIEYTSCVDGLEGIEGFQVRGLTPGLPVPLLEAALRDSVYEPGPDCPSQPTPEQMERFPVTFGYTVEPSGAVMYRARYSGRDFTGRWGNYFVHALAFPDAVEGPPGRPIDLWDSPVWNDVATVPGELPMLPGLPENSNRARLSAATGSLLQDPGHRATLAAFLGAARRRIDGERRLILLVPGSDQAAMWMAALSRSLPRRLVATLTFTTYTTRPDAHRALLAFTTPDVYVPRYGSYDVLDLTARHEGTAPAGDYDRIVADSWEHDGPETLVRQAEAIVPPLRSGELDAFACLATLSARPAGSLDEATLLGALEFGVARAPDLLPGPDAVTAFVTVPGRLTHVARWGELLPRLGPGLPPEVLESYVEGVIVAAQEGRAPDPGWLPPLDEGGHRGVVERLLLPAVLAPAPSAALLRWLGTAAGSAPLLHALLSALEREVHAHGDLQRASTLLPADTAAFVVRAVAAGCRLGLVAELSLVGHGRRTPAEVLTRLRPEALSPDDAAQLAAVLWPRQCPDAGEILALLADVPLPVLDAVGLPEVFVQRLVDDADAGQLGREHTRIARRLADSGLARQLSTNGLDTVEAVRLCDHFAQRSNVFDGAVRRVRQALELSDRVSRPIAADLFGEISGWLLQLRDVPTHRLLLGELSGHPRFASAYLERSRADLRSVRAEQAARIVTVWAAPDVDAVLRRELVDDVLPAAIRRKGKRYLDTVGQCLSWSADLDAWWSRWRRQHEGSSVLRTAIRRLGPGRVRRNR